MANRRPSGLSKALGLPSKPRPSSKRLTSVSHGALRRASPDENVRMGFSPKARRYIDREVKKVTKATASVSARQAETKRVRELHGVSLREATELRREGHLSYSSMDQKNRVDKAADRRLQKKVRASHGESLTTTKPNGGKYKIRLTNDVIEHYERMREKKLRGEWIDDDVDWIKMYETAKALNDHRLMQLRASPGVNSRQVGL